MPTNYDAGALLDELEKLKVFRVEIRDHLAMLVPAEMESPKPANLSQARRGLYDQTKRKRVPKVDGEVSRQRNARHVPAKL